MADRDPPPTQRELLARFLVNVIRHALQRRGMYLTDEDLEPIRTLDVVLLQQILRSVLPPEKPDAALPPRQDYPPRTKPTTVGVLRGAAPDADSDRAPDSSRAGAAAAPPRDGRRSGDS